MNPDHTHSHYALIVRKRCPKCKSGDIHKRVRRGGDIKTYRCYRCDHEFDTPFIGTKEFKTVDKEGLKTENGLKTEESDR